MPSPNFGNWPPGSIAGWCIINGVTGAVIKQSGGIFGVFSHEATGHCRVTLTGLGAETEAELAVIATATDDGGAASSTRICSYGITAGAPAPALLNLYTRDAAGALADAPEISVLVLGQP